MDLVTPIVDLEVMVYAHVSFKHEYTFSYVKIQVKVDPSYSLCMYYNLSRTNALIAFLFEECSF